MSEYHIVKSGLRRLMPLLLLVIMILAMMPMGSFAADETLYGFRVSYNNTQTQLADTRWMNSNLGNGWAEGDWVPYQLVLTGITSLSDLSEVAVAYDFYNSQNDAVLVDLVRGFQVRWSADPDDEIALTDDQMGYPSSQTSPITTVDEMEAAQTNPIVGQWDDFAIVDVPKEQLNIGYNGTTFVPLTPTSPVAHFRITDEQLMAAGVPNDVSTIVIYFQLHLARTSLWSSGLFQHYGDVGVPAEEWGGHIYKEGTAFDGVSNKGSFSYPGSSGHAKLIGATRTVPIPIPSQNLGSVTGYKWHDMNGDGIKDANEPFLANWPIYITADIEGMSFVLSTMTDANGVYNFPTLTYGTRYITEGVTRGAETGWTQTFPTGEFDVTAPFGGFDSYNDYLNDIDEGSGVELADQGYMIVIDRNNFAFTDKNFGNRMTGDLEITKLFDYEGVVGFTDEMLPESIGIHVTGPSFDPDGADFDLLKDDDYYLLLEDLLPGDYSITEINVPEGWDAPDVPIDVSVIAGDVVEIDFTNVFLTGSLKITKAFDFEGIEGFDAETMLPNEITVEVTGPSYPTGTEVDITISDEGIGEVTLNNLIPGNYTVDELAFTGSELWDSDIDPESFEVVGGALTAVQVDITNTFEPGELKITKEFDFEGIVGFDPDTMLPAEITVMVKGNSYPLGTEVDIPISELGVGEVTIGNLIPGDYTVDELEFTGSDMWESLITGSPAAVVAGAETTVTVSITNTFIPGDLEITKFFDFEGVVGFTMAMLPDSIDIHITGPSYDPDGLDITLYKADDYYVKLENLIPGDYSIDEIIVGDEWEAPELPITEEVLADGLVSVSFTNVYVPGDLEITKLFDYEGVVGFEESMLPEAIDIHIEGPSYDPDGLDVTLEKAEGYYVKLENLLPGTYEITEVNVPDDWMAPTLPIEVDVENGETASVEFTNVFMTGSLMITKNFVGGDETLWPEEIVVVVTGPSYLAGHEVVIEIDQVTGSGSVTLDSLIPGEYSFSELAFVGSENFSSSISPQSVMVVAGAASPAMVTITNTMAYHDETAWAFGGNENWDSVKSKNWGWNIGPITNGYDVTHELIAGAGGNIVENGTLVGHVRIVYSGGFVTVTYHMLDGFELMDTHVWIGSTNLPKMKNGKMTDSPGQFPYEDGVSIAVTGPVYVAAHAVVRMPGN